MTLFVLLLPYGGCVVVAAGDDAAARQRAKDLRADVEIATVRELESFAAQFLLTDDGELKSILSMNKRSLICALTSIQSLTPHALNRMPISIRLRPTAKLNMSSMMLLHKSISTHGMTATSAWFLTSSSRSVTGWRSKRFLDHDD